MTQPAKTPEPSMEEILASIRRIIADDDPAKPAATPDVPPRPVVAAAPAAEPSMQSPSTEPVSPAPAPQPVVEDVLELTEAMAAPAEQPTIGFRTINGESDLMFEDGSDQDAAPMKRPEPAPSWQPPRQQTPPDEDPLVSSVTSAAVDSAFNSLSHTVLVHNARTLEDIVREMLRPMLKTWLDSNLPGIVDRLVRAEIERVSRGRG
jgi:hypothetical protein